MLTISRPPTARRMLALLRMRVRGHHDVYYNIAVGMGVSLGLLTVGLIYCFRKVILILQLTATHIKNQFFLDSTLTV